MITQEKMTNNIKSKTELLSMRSFNLILTVIFCLFLVSVVSAECPGASIIFEPSPPAEGQPLTIRAESSSPYEWVHMILERDNQLVDFDDEIVCDYSAGECTPIAWWKYTYPADQMTEGGYEAIFYRNCGGCSHYPCDSEELCNSCCEFCTSESFALGDATEPPKPEPPKPPDHGEPKYNDFCVHTLMLPDDYVDILDHVDALGAKWIKELFLWSVVEGAPGERNWELYDKWIGEAKSRDIKIIARLQGSPNWAMQGHSSPQWGYRPDKDKYDDFAKFAADFAQRYPDTVKYVEIWNEQNYGYEWSSSGPNPEEYVDLLKAVKSEFDRRGVGAKIIFGGLGATATQSGFMNEFDFLDRAYSYDSNLGNYYDYLGHHPYGQQGKPDDTCGDSDKDCWYMDRIKVLYNHLGDKKPIMVTEFGWWIDWVESERKHGQYLQASYRQLKNKDKYPFVEQACWWVLTNDHKWDKTGNLLKAGGTEGSIRPAYYCYQSLTQASCDHEYIDICPCQDLNTGSSSLTSKKPQYQIGESTEFYWHGCDNSLSIFLNLNGEPLASPTVRSSKSFVISGPQGTDSGVMKVISICFKPEISVQKTAVKIS